MHMLHDKYYFGYWAKKNYAYGLFNLNLYTVPINRFIEQIIRFLQSKYKYLHQIIFESVDQRILYAVSLTHTVTGDLVVVAFTMHVCLGSLRVQTIQHSDRHKLHQQRWKFTARCCYYIYFFLYFIFAAFMKLMQIVFSKRTNRKRKSVHSIRRILFFGVSRQRLSVCESMYIAWKTTQYFEQTLQKCIKKMQWHV